jgi:hypothetical protein
MKGADHEVVRSHATRPGCACGAPGDVIEAARCWCAACWLELLASASTVEALAFDYQEE